MCWGFHYQTVNNCKKTKQNKKHKDASGASVPPTPTTLSQHLGQGFPLRGGDILLWKSFPSLVRSALPPPDWIPP